MVQAETARLKAAAARAAAEKTSLEQAADELEARCRAAIAAEEDSRYDTFRHIHMLVCLCSKPMRAELLSEAELPLSLSPPQHVK